MPDTKTILRLIAGASLGAIAGILLAPHSGAATREKIKKKCSELKNTVSNRVEDLLDTLEKGVKEELKPEDRNSVPKMNEDIA